VLTPFEGFTVTSTTSGLLGVWNVRWVLEAGAGSSYLCLHGCGGWVAHCWALRNQAVLPDGRVTLVFLWLFGCWIVDASIFVAVLLKTSLEGGVLFVLCLCVWRQAMKGVWWMPWHQEPMKDVGACDKPWGVGNRAVIRGCPNGETWLESCPVTCT
jgi:hypothetical protein